MDLFHQGPDICGYSTKKVHVIFSYKGKNHLIKKEIKCKVNRSLKISGAGWNMLLWSYVSMYFLFTSGLI